MKFKIRVDTGRFFFQKAIIFGNKFLLRFTPARRLECSCLPWVRLPYLHKQDSAIDAHSFVHFYLTIVWYGGVKLPEHILCFVSTSYILRTWKLHKEISYGHTLLWSQLGCILFLRLSYLPGGSLSGWGIGNRDVASKCIYMPTSPPLVNSFLQYMYAQSLSFPKFLSVAHLTLLTHYILTQFLPPFNLFASCILSRSSQTHTILFPLSWTESLLSFQ